MTSIDDLARRLEQIDSNFDKDTQLKGQSFDKTENNSFGVPDSTDFTVFLSFEPQWPDKVPGNSADDAPTKFPSPLQRAFKQVLKAGLDTDKKKCFIDLATLFDLTTPSPPSGFFTEGGQESVASALLSAVDEIDPEVQPVIRIVCGEWSDDAPSKWEEDGKWRKTFEEIFWDGQGKSRLKKNKKAIVCVGYYRPILATVNKEGTYAPTEQWLKDRLGDVTNLVKQLNSFVTGLPNTERLTSAMQKFDAASYLTTLIKSGYLQKHISWNHGKVLAVNGKTMMTGGGNYWNCYKGDQHDIIDQQAKVTGEAAISAHRWADYFWDYLNNIPGSDSQSFRRSANLSEPPKWTEAVAPRLPTFAKDIRYGNKKVLTVSRIGDWHGKMKGVAYPIGIVDALRDALLNGVYLYFHNGGPRQQGAMTILTYAILTEDGEALRRLTEAATNIKRGVGGAVLDWFASLTRPEPSLEKQGSFNPYQTLNVNPNAWASRFARVCAIANAKESVILCQHRLACPPYAGEKVTNLLNEKWRLQDPNKWDGYLWPFDLLIAFGYALARTRNTKTGSAKITIVLATHCQDGTRGDWEDKASIGDLKKKLKVVMRGMAHLNSFTRLVPSFFTNAAAAADVFTHVDPVPENLIDKVVDERFIVKRALGNIKWYYNHCKIVCVDGRLLYVGSDNAYPSFNEEHGVWIEDAAEVDSWKKKFWNGMEARAVVPTDEPEK
ncbi:hypothetical protein AYO20_01659 [Fonsecaea nubica]|uniref:PLD phosphodiesterase domain-containing protein n=1 Tax=Fonsecaea nubica TaxID=856822 RepID=A0A178DA21_9EURO|nr:hypothetical protein AYO20_01659 [Fonsecaea nubica]OAL38908.1 hypothetical protein AYO20_01659 [Fonsecaea nubica]